MQVQTGQCGYYERNNNINHPKYKYLLVWFGGFFRLTKHDKHKKYWKGESNLPNDKDRNFQEVFKYKIQRTAFIWNTQMMANS